MQTRVHRLRETLKFLELAVPKKPALPILTNVLIQDGKAHATDLANWVSLELPEGEEAFLIPYRPVAALLESVPGDEMLNLEVEKKMLNLSWSGGKASYDVADLKEYPSVPGYEANAEADIDGDALVGALNALVPFCATETNRPVLNGVVLYLGEKMTAAAADGFRMAYLELPFTYPLEQTADIGPQAIKILTLLWKKNGISLPMGNTLVGQLTAKRMLRLSVNGKTAAFHFGRAALIAKLIEGTPPDFKKLIPAATTNKVRIFAPDFYSAVGRIQTVAKENKGVARLTWEDSVMTLSATAPEMGAVEATIPAVTDDGPGKIGMDVKYLKSYFQGKEDFVTMGTTDARSPALFTYRQAPKVVMMPMYVKWKGDPEEETPEEKTPGEEEPEE